VFFWFPRAGVVTHSRRASVLSLRGGWNEKINDLFMSHDEHVGVGTYFRRQSALQNGTLARPEWVTTPARGNQKIKINEQERSI